MRSPAAPPAESAPAPTWFRQLAPRSTAHWQLKALAIPLFVAAFFAAYFQLLRYPVFPVTVMPLTAIDRLIGFHPVALLPYAALWLYVFLAPALLQGRREIAVYTLEVVALTGTALGFFHFWPTAVPPPVFDAALPPLLAFLKNVDATGNACPSLHVAFAIFTAIWLARFLRVAAAPAAWHLLNAGTAAAIVYSTLATKQHVAVDMFAGLALGAAAACVTPRSLTAAASTLCRHQFRHRLMLAFTVSLSGKFTLLALGPDLTGPVAIALLFVIPDLWILTLVGLQLYRRRRPPLA